MKTLLVSVNSKYIHSSLAVWYLKSACGEFKDDIEIIETTIKKDVVEFADFLLSKNADIIAFSSYIFNINFVKNAVSYIKEQSPKTMIVLGGPEVSYNVEEVFECTDCDYILSGEGEIPFYNLIKALKNSEKPEGEGISTREKISEPFIWNEEPKNPYTKEYFEALNGRIVYLESSRGCPYSCSYCLSGRLCGVRFFDLDRLKRNIDLLSKSGTKTIKFVDRTFNCNPKRAKEIVEYIIETNSNNKDICFHFEIKGDILDEDLISTLNKAPKGLFQIEVGLQSFNKETLDAVRCKTDLEKLKENMKKVLGKENIHVHMDLIAGLPKETYQSFKNGVDEMYKIKPHMIQIGFLKLLKGSPLEKEECGEFNETAPYEIIENNYLSKEDLKKIKLVEDALERLYNSGRFTDVVELALEKSKMTPFELFMDFSLNNPDMFKVSLNDFTEKVYNYFVEFIEEAKLKEIMRKQWITLNPSKLPPILRDENSGKILKELDKMPEYKREKGVKRSAIYIESEKTALWVDYKEKDRVTKKYQIKKLRINFL